MSKHHGPLQHSKESKYVAKVLDASELRVKQFEHLPDAIQWLDSVLETSRGEAEWADIYRDGAPVWTKGGEILLERQPTPPADRESFLAKAEKLLRELAANKE